MGNSRGSRDGSSGSCYCSANTRGSKVVVTCASGRTNHGSGKIGHSSEAGNKCRGSSTTTYGLRGLGAAVGWVLLVGALLFTPQLYMFHVYGEEKAKSKGQPAYADRRLSSEATILLAATPEQVLLLNDSLVLPTANVTAQEVSIQPVSSVDQEMEALLAEKNVVGTKDLRITVVFMDDQPVNVDNSKPTSKKGAVCKEGQRAMLVSFGDVRRNGDDKVFVELMLHSPSVSKFARPLPEWYNLEALNPVAWGNNRLPTVEEMESFQGTAICLTEGSPLQLVKGWPTRVPEYKDGPWEARVKVERAFVTASAMEKQKKLLLQAMLKVLREPREGIFKEQNLSEIPFMGYVKAEATKQKNLAGALIRHQLLNKTCKLRREKEKSQVELLCDDVEADLADLSEMVEERPMLREVFKKTGIFAGISAAAFGLALASHMLGAISKNLEVFSIPTCLWGGSAVGVVSLLHAAIAGPIAAVKRFKWREKFGLKKRKFLKKVVEEEKSLSSSTAAAVDLVLVVNELEHQSQEVPDPSQLGINADIKPDVTLVEDPAKISPLAAKVQPFVSRYIYLNTIKPATQRFEARGFSRFKQQADDDARELARLQDFLRKAGKLNAELLPVDEYGDFEFTAQQKLRAYMYLGEHTQRELSRNLDETNRSFLAVEALYSKEKADRMLKKMKELYRDVKSAGGDPPPIDTTKPLITSLKKRLRQVKGSEDFIDEELLRFKEEMKGNVPPAEEEELKVARKELVLARAAVKEAVDVLSQELRVSFDNDLQLALEEADNLKEALNSLKKTAGDQPSPQQKAEIRDTVRKIAKLNQKVVSTVYEMRTLGIEVDVRNVPVEFDTHVEEE